MKRRKRRRVEEEKEKGSFVKNTAGMNLVIHSLDLYTLVWIEVNLKESKKRFKKEFVRAKPVYRVH